MVDALDAMAELFDTANAEAQDVVHRALAAWGEGADDVQRIMDRLVAEVRERDGKA